MSEPKLSELFRRGDKANSQQYHTYCKACIAEWIRVHVDTSGMGAAEALATELQGTEQAVATMGDGILGHAPPWIAHLLGGQGITRCPYASKKARDIARSKDTRKKRPPPSPTKLTTTESESTSAASLKRPADSQPSAAQPSKKQKSLDTFLKPTKGVDAVFSDSHRTAIQAQCERVVVSCNLSEDFFTKPEVKALLKMFRSRAEDVLPSRKVIGGRLLTDAANLVDENVIKLFQDKYIGIQSDAWSRFRRGITGVCGVQPGVVKVLQLVDTTAAHKDGESMRKFFTETIAAVEKKYKCKVYYFVTDADGGSKKGRALLANDRPDLFTPSCFAHQNHLCVGDYFKVYPFALEICEDTVELVNWINNHDKVRDVFDKTQKLVSPDENQGKVIVLAYSSPNDTRWTTIATSFLRFLRLERSLSHAALMKEQAIVNAQVGAATSTEKVRLETEARAMVARLRDRSGRFWAGLEAVVGDLEPICFSTNIAQSDDVRPDQILLAFAGMYLHFAKHPEDEVRLGMSKRLEKRWKDTDQPLFLLTLVLNPFDGTRAFGPDAGFNAFKLASLLRNVYRRIQNRPDNTDDNATRLKKETAVENAFFNYIASRGIYKDFRDEQEDWIQRRGNCPRIAWTHALSGGDLGERELSELALRLHNIVCQTAGTERLFSKLKIRLSDHQNRTLLTKLEKKAKVGESIHHEHVTKKLIPEYDRKRTNHSNTSSLLEVPRHGNLLEDQDAEDEIDRGRALVSAEDSWRVEMAAWIGERRRAVVEPEVNEASDDEDEDDSAPGREPPARPTREEVAAEDEREARNAAADALEDGIPDDGAIEVGSDDEYCG
ncbi:ribonuclease H-like domain-containing protein [Roridomyces roridus]|uniref:Ribonuclease H-like domain-containing protein n=1 Tax=Roridomyces roridus TaxID=1738132 RepID=A0AAD7C8C3_9AGAR|nr:ribonuclease H-like domain-containing protein [Roridomyces roridus]